MSAKNTRSKAEAEAIKAAVDSAVSQALENLEARITTKVEETVFEKFYSEIARLKSDNESLTNDNKNLKSQVSTLLLENHRLRSQHILADGAQKESVPSLGTTAAPITVREPKSYSQVVSSDHNQARKPTANSAPVSRKPAQVKSAPVIGSGIPNTSKPTLKVVKTGYPVTVMVSRLAFGTTPEEVEDYVKTSTGLSVKAQYRAPRKWVGLYSTFLLSANSNDLPKLLQSEVWPENAFVKRFYLAKKRQTIPTDIASKNEEHGRCPPEVSITTQNVAKEATDAATLREVELLVDPPEGTPRKSNDGNQC